MAHVRPDILVYTLVHGQFWYTGIPDTNIHVWFIFSIVTIYHISMYISDFSTFFKRVLWLLIWEKSSTFWSNWEKQYQYKYCSQDENQNKIKWTEANTNMMLSFFFPKSSPLFLNFLNVILRFMRHYATMPHKSRLHHCLKSTWKV